MATDPTVKGTMTSPLLSRRNILLGGFGIAAGQANGQARAAIMPHSTLAGDANLLVLPNIDAANISYNLLKTAAGGGIAIGPMLLGVARPAHILTASATVRRIVNMTALTVSEANAGPRASQAATPTTA